MRNRKPNRAFVEPCHRRIHNPDGGKLVEEKICPSTPRRKRRTLHEEETDETDTININGEKYIIIKDEADLLRNWQAEAELQNQREEIQRRRKKATTSKATSAASTSAASKAAPKAASTGALLTKARPLPKPRTKSTEHVWTQTTWMMAPKDVVIITEREAGTTWNDAETQTEGILIIKDQGLRGRFGCVAEKGGASSVAAGSDASSSD